jgi:ribosomal protein S18 acetylase RimI-like enzyme
MDDRIRIAIAEDESILWEMLRYAAHQTSVTDVREQPHLARYVTAWGRSGDLGCIADRGTTAVGAAWLRLWRGEDKGFGYISDEIPELAFAVLPDYRGQGIGTQLLMQVLNMAKENFPAVSLSVRSDNPVVRLYQRSGFIKVKDSEVINLAGGISFNMVCNLEARV